ncbi:MAG: hypothetical protein J6V24_08415 [Clostridia bacterium]|nr:hypothetical protein [Clostridia bacterium]
MRKIIFAGALCALIALSALLCACGRRDAGAIDAVDGAADLPKDGEPLTERTPEYFDLSTFKGLEVYVWSMAEGSYSCGILPGTNRNKTQKEIWELGLHSVSVDEMKEILASYDIPDEEVFLFACHQPISSYYYDIDSAYCAAVAAQFDNRYACFSAPEMME